MICKQCNNNVPNDSEYCPFCGNVVEKVIVETNPVSDVDKGYTYLELKEWEKAKEIFDFAIVNNDNKAKAYIGRLLAKLKLSDLVSLSSVNKKLTKFDDFKMAIKYADENYKQQLKKCYSLVEEKINQKKAKSKIRAIISSISCVSLIVLLVLTYFVFIPLGRFSYYKNLLSNGNIEKASKSFSNSEWFEFNEKAEGLFYNKGVSLVENKDYKNAEFCFDITKDFKDSYNYYNYCKGNRLLLEKNITAYTYFSNCKNFSDTKNLIKETSWLNTIELLQGTWHLESSEKETKSHSNSNKTDEKIKGRGSAQAIYIPIYTIDVTITFNGIEKLKLLDNGKIGYKEYSDEHSEIKIINDSKIEIFGNIYSKE